MTNCNDGCEHEQVPPVEEQIKKIEETKPADDKQPQLFQNVVVALADGRIGVFAGPAILTPEEITKPPRLTAVDFHAPYELKLPEEAAAQAAPAGEVKGATDGSAETSNANA